MSVPSSVEELLQLIRKSGMVDEPKLTGYLQRRQIGRGPLPTDPREAADAMIADGLLTNFQAEQFLLGKWRGFTIGKYKLLERVGVGGMGQVFLCEHMFMKRKVAIKVLPPAKAEQPAALGRFYREARAAGSLEHPNIVRTHDIDQDGNLHFIVMEYVDGSNMLEMVKKFGPMDLRRAASYVRQVAVALEFAHKNGLIHRDVKPGNILIDRRGHSRLLDMGLARFYNDTTDLLTVKYDDKIVLGTADYVAPEQVANSHAVDTRADIYGLGATLYFLVAGHPPFPTGTVSQKLLWHRTKEPTPIRQIRPEVPEELAAIVAKMMAKDPNKRFQSPGEVAVALTKFVPAGVPMPAAAEMPQMCPAVQEILTAMAEASSDRMSMVEEPVGLVAATAEAAPIARGGYGGPVNPFDPPLSSNRPIRAAAMNLPTPNPAPMPFRPAPAAANPFAAVAVHPPAAAPDPTPMPGAFPGTAQHAPPLLHQSPIPFSLPAEKPKAGKIALFALVGVGLVLGGGYAGWKLFAAPKPAAVSGP